MKRVRVLILMVTTVQYSNSLVPTGLVCWVTSGESIKQLKREHRRDAQEKESAGKEDERGTMDISRTMTV